MVSDFGCELTDKTVILTDRGANMKKAFEKHQHVACICHLLNNVIQKTIEEVPEVAHLKNLCIKLVKYFKKSGLNASLTTSLKSFCPTRWNTVYDMLKSIEINWSEIIQILQSKNDLGKIGDISITSIKAVCKLLQPFEEASKELEGDKYATMHLVLVYLHQLKSACNSESDDLDLVLNMKRKLQIYLNTIVYGNVSIFHKLALFLFPPTNQLVQFSDNEKQLVEEECRRILESLQNQSPATQENINSQPPVCKQMKLFTAFIQQDFQNNSHGAVTRELEGYKNTRVAYEVDFNVFSWWELHKNSFPLLHRLSCIVFVTPASSASSERVFSVARNLICARRTALSLNEIGISQLIFSHMNIDNVQFDN